MDILYIYLFYFYIKMRPKFKLRSFENKRGCSSFLVDNGVTYLSTTAIL